MSPSNPEKLGATALRTSLPLLLWIGVLATLAACASSGSGKRSESPVAAPQIPATGESLRFRVLTFNTLKLGGPVPPERVMDRMLELEPDVLLLQEVFNTRRIKNDFRALNARRLLTRRLEDDYHVVWLGTSGPSGFLRVLTFGRYRDGLMIAARKDRWDFDRRTGYHTLRLPSVGKYNLRGVQAALLVRRDGSGGGSQRVLIANTHLTRGSEETHGEVRREQARELRRFVGDLERTTRADAVVLGGDFNAHETDALIQSLASTGENTAAGETEGLPVFRDAFREAEPTAPGITFDVANTLVGDRPESERIDYLWLRPLDPAALAVRSVRVVLDEADAETGQNLSDHYGVLAELELSRP